MVTTISIDKEIRDKAAKKAQIDKLSVSAVIRILLMDYADGNIKIGTRLASEPKVEIIKVDKETQNIMDDVIKTWNK